MNAGPLNERRLTRPLVPAGQGPPGRLPLGGGEPPAASCCVTLAWRRRLRVPLEAALCNAGWLACGGKREKKMKTV